MKPLLNEAEKFLVQRWAEAQALVEGMDTVRNKYKALAQSVIDTVQREHPELDAAAFYVTQFWGEGWIGIGRKCWPADQKDWPGGFWMENLRLEVLTDDEAAQPYICVWIPEKAAKTAKIDLPRARAQLRKATKGMFSADDFAKIFDVDGDEAILLAYRMPEKRKLIELLVNGDGQEFVRTMVGQFDALARLTPAIDDILQVK